MSLNRIKAQIGTAFKLIRNQQGLTQMELGKKIGVNNGQVSKIESGSQLTIPMIIKIAKALDIKTVLILGDMRVKIN